MIRSCVEEITLGNYEYYTVRGCPGPDSGSISDKLDNQRDILIEFEKYLLPGECCRLLGCHHTMDDLGDLEACFTEEDGWIVLLEATG